MGSAAQSPYQGLAPIYDYVMAHVGYGEWAAYIHALFARFAPAATRVVDLACGTGNVSFALHRLGYEVTGVDRSEAMLEVAREKATDTGVEFVQQDLRQLGALGPFDAATCLYDSINYLLAPADIDAALRGTQAIVQPGGLFVFDICTERNSLRYFRNMRDSGRGPGFSYRAAQHLRSRPAATAQSLPHPPRWERCRVRGNPCPAHLFGRRRRRPRRGECLEVARALRRFHI